MQAELAINSPRITYSDRQNSLLREENNSMKQKLDAFSSELMLKEGKYTHTLSPVNLCLKNLWLFL